MRPSYTRTQIIASNLLPNWITTPAGGQGIDGIHYLDSRAVLPSPGVPGVPGVLTVGTSIKYLEVLLQVIVELICPLALVNLADATRVIEVIRPEQYVALCPPVGNHLGRYWAISRPLDNNNERIRSYDELPLAEICDAVNTANPVFANHHATWQNDIGCGEGRTCKVYELDILITTDGAGSTMRKLFNDQMDRTQPDSYKIWPQDVFVTGGGGAPGAHPRLTGASVIKAKTWKLAPPWFRADFPADARSRGTRWTSWDSHLTWGDLGFYEISGRYSRTHCQLIFNFNGNNPLSLKMLKLSKLANDKSCEKRNPGQRAAFAFMTQLFQDGIYGQLGDGATDPKRPIDTNQMTAWQNTIQISRLSGILFSMGVGQPKLIVSIDGDAEATSYFEEGDGMSHHSVRSINLGHMINSVVSLPNNIANTLDVTLQGFIDIKTNANKIETYKTSCVYLANMIHRQRVLAGGWQATAKLFEPCNTCKTSIATNTPGHIGGAAAVPNADCCACIDQMAGVTPAQYLIAHLQQTSSDSVAP